MIDGLVNANCRRIICLLFVLFVFFFLLFCSNLLQSIAYCNHSWDSTDYSNTYTISANTSLARYSKWRCTNTAAFSCFNKAIVDCTAFIDFWSECVDSWCWWQYTSTFGLPHWGHKFDQRNATTNYCRRIPKLHQYETKPKPKFSLPYSNQFGTEKLSRYVHHNYLLLFASDIDCTAVCIRLARNIEREKWPFGNSHQISIPFILCRLGVYFRIEQWNCLEFLFWMYASKFHVFYKSCSHSATIP